VYQESANANPTLTTRYAAKMPNAMPNDAPPFNFFGFVDANPISIKATTHSAKISHRHGLQIERFIHVSIRVGTIDAAGGKKE
jgi:hypothetical protein